MARAKTKPNPSWSTVLQAGRFAEVCDALERLTEKNHQQTYILGYAYWRLGQPYKAMAHWWKLAHKVEKSLLDDLYALSEHVRSADTVDHPDWESLSLSEQKSLFLCIRRLVPDAPTTHQLRDHLYQKLWQADAYEELKRITQSDPGLSRGERLIWLAKLQFRMGRQFKDWPQFVDIYVSGLATFLKQKNDRFDAAAVSHYVLELQHWLANHLLDRSKVEALTRYARHSLVAMGGLVQHPAIQRGELLLTPGYLWRMDPADPMRLCYLDALRETETDPSLLEGYVNRHSWEAMKSGASPLMVSSDSSAARVPFVTIQNRPDPFQTLRIGPESSKAEVMAAVMKLIREQPQNMATWRGAQAEIFDPERVQRILFFNHPPRRRKCLDFCQVNQATPLTKTSIALPYRGPKEFAPYAE